MTTTEKAICPYCKQLIELELSTYLPDKPRMVFVAHYNKEEEYCEYSHCHYSKRCTTTIIEE